MKNQDVLNILTNQFDQLKKQLESTVLTEEFKLLINTIKGGSVFGAISNRKLIGELKKYSKDKSSNDVISSCIERLKNLNHNIIKSQFKKSIKIFFDDVIKKHNDCQTIIAEYDHYEDPESVCCGLKLQEIGDIKIPRYLREEVNWDEVLFDTETFINFQNCWLDVEELEYTTIGLDVYYDTQKLVQLNSIILLHETFREMEVEGYFKQFERQVDFLINEHDCEVIYLYRVNLN